MPQSYFSGHGGESLARLASWKPCDKMAARITRCSWVEEESNVGDIVLKLEQMADTPSAVYLLDKELGTRVFTMPATGE